MKNSPFFWGSLLGSFLLVALGQSSWVEGFSIAASAFGYALFWRAMLTLEKRGSQFWLSAGWFASVQAVQLSWLTSTHYMGPLILLIYTFLIVAIGAQFGLLSLFFSDKKISLSGCLAGAGSWVLLEWIRLLPFSGFTWNPAGLALAGSTPSIQFAALFGVYGLSFWVIFVNLFAIYAQGNNKRWAIWASLALFPYLFGWLHQTWIEKNFPPEKTISVALVQTAFLPEEKDEWVHRSAAFIPPLNQWELICDSLREDRRLDLLILPEGAVSMSAYRPFYPIESLKEFWVHRFGEAALSDLPPCEPPMAALDWSRGGKRIWKATNAMIAQGLANHFHSHVIVGFDDQEEGLKYNAAFHFQPDRSPQRYEKRILVPIAEYIPFPNLPGFTKFLIDQFGIGDSFNIGKEAKLFEAPWPIGVSICLEETYSALIRELKVKGAHLLVNISNDVWFPESRLPYQHFLHGRIRAAENGVHVLRSCNMGVTGGVNCFGGVIGAFNPADHEIGILYLHIPLRSFQTLYSLWGDGAILFFSSLFLLFWFRKKKLLLNGSLR